MCPSGASARLLAIRQRRSSRLGVTTLTLGVTTLTLGVTGTAACAALWGFEPAEPVNAEHGGGGAVSGGGSGPAGASAGAAGGAGGAGGEPFVHHQEGRIELRWDFAEASSLYNVDQEICLRQVGSHAQWQLGWTWSGKSYGGHVALRTHGLRFDESVGPTMVFRLDYANGSRSGACEAIEGEPPGGSCRLPFDLVVDRCYRLRIWRLEADTGGQWWGCWILDRQTEVETSIGGLRAPLDASAIGSVSGQASYEGMATGCDEVPVAVGLLAAPGGNQAAPDIYSFDAIYGGFSRAACTGGGVEPGDLGWRPSVEVTLGGPR